MTANTTLRPPPPAAPARLAPLPDPPKAPDAMQQSPYISRAYLILDTYFRSRPDVLVGSDGYLCYDTRDPARWGPAGLRGRVRRGPRRDLCSQRLRD